MKSNSCVSDVTISTSDTPTQCITITPPTVTLMCSGRGKKYNVARGGSPAEIHGDAPRDRSKRLDPRRDTARQTAGRRASRFAGEGMRFEIITQKCGFVLIFSVGMQRTNHPAQR